LACSPGVCLGGSVEVHGFPFVKAAMLAIDATGLTTANIRVSESGSVCMSGGTIIDFASLGLWLAESPPLPAGENVVSLDLVRLGITQMRVETSVARPLRSGLGLTFVKAFPPGSCPPDLMTPGPDGGPPGCSRPTFFRRKDSINGSGSTTVRLDEFDPTDPPVTINQGVDILFFDIVEFKATYDLCIHDLAFLDPTGQEVAPPAGTGDAGGS
jgi:hypothetical protein